ncbi:hypothetical protein GW796_06935 [archaeon]|nr:hypothetical protein [archaeon]
MTKINLYFKKNILNISVFVFIIFIILKVFLVWESVISSFYTGIFFDKKILLELVGDTSLIQSRMITVGLLLTIWMVFKRTITPVVFALILYVSFYLKIYDFKIYELMDRVIHPFMVSTGIFNSFMRGGIHEINPQYTRLSFFLFFSLVLIGLVIYKKTRTIDRVFVALISWSIVLTTVVFHLSLPMISLKYTKNERMETFISNAYKDSEDIFCKDKTCIFLDENLNEIDDKFVGLIEDKDKFKGFLNESKVFFSKKENRKFPIYGMSGNFTGIFITFTVGVYKGDYFLIIFDSNAMKDYGNITQILFCFLSITSYSVWIFFGLFLLFLHKKRIINKFVKNN